MQRTNAIIHRLTSICTQYQRELRPKSDVTPILEVYLESYRIPLYRVPFLWYDFLSVLAVVLSCLASAYTVIEYYRGR